jgi:hypothetical protein
MRRVNGISDVTGIHCDMACGTGPQIDAAKLVSRSGMDHPEVVRGHLVNPMSRKTGQLQLEIAIPKLARLYVQSR